MIALLKGINIFHSNMLLKNQSTGITVSTFLKEINIFHFGFSAAPESAASSQKGVYKQTPIGRRRALYRWAFKTINNLVRMSGHGGRSGSSRTDRKLKSNMFISLRKVETILPGGRHGTVDSSL